MGRNFCLLCSSLCPQLLEQGPTGRAQGRGEEGSGLKHLDCQARKLSCALRTLET